jgi:hypothetical protein
MIDPKWHPLWPQWLRRIVWLWRNPPTIGPLKRQLSGISTWNPKGGWWFIYRHPGICSFGSDYLGIKDLSFTSYRGKHIEFYIGWRPSGAFGIAIRHANARGSETIQ